MAVSLRVIRTILLQEWDPIGVSDVPEAQDEYDSYVMPLYTLLRQKQSENAVVNYLYTLETKHMGLTRLNRDDLKPVTKHLLQLDLRNDEPLQ